jgi:hypothetical protein
VEELWSQGVTPLDYDVGIHYGRYVSVYAGFLLEDLLPNYGFSYYLSTWMILNIIMMNRIAEKILERKPGIWFYLLIIGMHLNMNGRGVILCSAWILCIWCLINIYNFSLLKSSLLLVSSLWFGSASTGVFFVIFFTFFFFILRGYFLQFSSKEVNKKIGLMYILLVFIVLLLGLDYLVSAVEKNLHFYGGDLDGLINMLEHGYGHLVFKNAYIFVVIIALVAIFKLIYLKSSKRIKLNSELSYFIIIPILFGVFGYSVLALSIFPIILRAHLIFTNFKI